MKSLYSSLLFLLCSGALFSQKASDQFSLVQRTPTGEIRCLTMEADAFSRAMYPERGSLEEFEQWLSPKIEAHRREMLANGNRVAPLLTIPVVVHVIHNGDALGTGENINNAQVLSQIRVLNEDFRRLLGSPGYNNDPVGADIEIEFCMAQVDPLGNPTNGIDRVNYGVASFTSMANTDAMKAATSWNPNEYMNMWSVRFGGGMAGTLGYAQFPDGSGLPGLGAIGGPANTDGVVSSFDAFGSQAYAAGSYNPTYNLGRTMTHEIGHWLGLRHIWGDGGCAVDDFCNDTPASSAANFGCPNIDRCAGGGADMVENYMDYSDDNCMNIFTVDQKARIRTVMTVSPRRMQLPFSTKCNPLSPEIGFVLAGTNVNEGTDCNYQDIVLNLSIAKAPSANATITFNSSGTATVGGVDYDFFPASVVFPAGSTPTRQVTVRVYNDGVVEPTESITMGFTLATAGDAIITGGPLANHSLNIIDDDFAPTPTINTNVLFADFESGMNGFTTTGNGGSDRFLLGNALAAYSTYWTIQGTNATQFAYSNDDRCNCNKAADRLISPVFSLIGYTNATLTFDHAFADAAAAEDARVEISTNGGTTYNNLLTLSNTSTALGGGAFSTPWVNGNTINLNAYSGMNNLRLRFVYNDGGAWNYGLAVDNVRIYSNVPAVIQEAINTGNKDNNRVGANETVHWYDPATNNVMGTIQNTSAWNYNCTTMEVDRSQVSVGAPTAAFWDPLADKHLMAKTFYVDPAANNATGVYNITFYFTEAEISEWETVTGKTRSFLKIVKVSNNPISAVNAGNYGAYVIEVIPATLGNFGSNVTLSASFASGFSGFGFGDPNTPVSFPIELLSFEGEKEGTGVALNWITGAELNNDYFSLERSSNGVDFESIAVVQGSETTSETHNYSYYDARPFAGNNYYRLVQFDFDGKTTISEIVLIEMIDLVLSGQGLDAMTLSPNPVNNKLNISFEASGSCQVTLEIFDISGRKITQIKKKAVEQGANQITLNTQDLLQGIYLIRTSMAGEVCTRRFVKY